MATTIRAHLFILFFVISQSATAAETRAGFFFPDNVSEVTFRFKSINGLIILPVLINDTVRVNLVLDTGCRNLVLFGKKFQKLFNTEPDKRIQFSGLGHGDAIAGRLSLNNKVSIAAVIGEKIPVVLIPQQNLFATYQNIHGVIGYDIFVKFEIELDPRKHLITFRPANTAILNAEYQKIPIRIEDSRPVIASQIFFTDSDPEACDIMIDTGSTLGLLVKTTDLKKFPKQTNKMKLGRGFNGPVMGVQTTTEKLVLNNLEIPVLEAGITYSAWHNYATLGMDIMKNYAIVLNYCQAYAGFKKVL